MWGSTSAVIDANRWSAPGLAQHEHGTLDLRVFDQDVWWVDIAQRPHRSTEMSSDYIANVITHLETHVEGFYHATMRRQLIQMHGDLLLGRISTEIVAQSLGATPMTSLTPEDWLEWTPWVRALRKRARGDAGGRGQQ